MELSQFRLKDLRLLSAIAGTEVVCRPRSLLNQSLDFAGTRLKSRPSISQVESNFVVNPRNGILVINRVSLGLTSLAK